MTPPPFISGVPPQRLVVAGIHTDAGKTLVSATLVAGLGATYWKPVQTGADPTLGLETDSEWVGRTLAPLNPVILPEAYRLKLPQSPHWAAEAEGVTVEVNRLVLPAVPGTLVIEGAGGVLVPLTDDTLFIDVMAQWQLPVVLVCRLYLGAINHTLLSLEALRARGVAVAGVVFNGEPQPQVERAIKQFGRVHVIGRMPVLECVSAERLAAVFSTFQW